MNWRKLVLWPRNAWRHFRFASHGDQLNIMLAIGSFVLTVMATVLTKQALEMGRRQELMAERQYQIQQRQLQLEADIRVDYASFVSDRLMFGVKNSGLAPTKLWNATVRFPQSNFELRCERADDWTDIRDKTGILTGNGYVVRNLAGTPRDLPAESFIAVLACQVAFKTNVTAPESLRIGWHAVTSAKVVESGDSTEIVISKNNYQDAVTPW